MSMQATKWQAQLNDATKFVGGLTGDPTGVNVSAVPMDQLRIFTVSHNTYSHTYYKPTNTWYDDGKVWNQSPKHPGQEYQYPTQYTLQDGSLLTVDWDSAAQNLKLTQV